MLGPTGAIVQRFGAGLAAEIALFWGPLLALSALAIFLRWRYPAPEGRWSSGPYRATKCLPMLWMLALAAFASPGHAASSPDQPGALGFIHDLRLAVMVGLLLGTLGDFFLLFRRTFLLGFTAFALGHVAYVVGFLSAPWVLSPTAVFACCLPGLIYAPIVLRRNQHPKMWPLILSYLMLIQLMLLSAINLAVYLSPPSTDAQNAQGIPALVCMVGAALFCFSDASWSWNRFVHPLRYAGVQVLGSYYAAQGAIVWGALYL